MPDSEVAGEVTSATSNSVIYSHDELLTKYPHCEECGTELLALYENDHLVAYGCPEHGILTHDAIVWVRHGEDS